MAEEAAEVNVELHGQMIVRLLNECGASEARFQDQTEAERISEDVFDDDFEAFIDVTNEDLTNAWKSYSSLTVANGRIILAPRVKKNIKALV